MLVHPQFDPIALQLGPLAVRWYGLMYLIGFGLIWIVGRARIARFPGGAWTANDLGDAIFYGILGTILGGRFGYVLFYKFGDYLAEPWRAFFVWEGGMSFHGGLLGVIFALWLFARSRKQDWPPSLTLSRRSCRWVSRPAGSATSSTPSCGGGLPMCPGR